jgi:hypothetical protein
MACGSPNNESSVLYKITFRGKYYFPQATDISIHTCRVVTTMTHGFLESFTHFFP